MTKKEKISQAREKVLEIHEEVTAFEHEVKIITKGVDWGKPKRQGKRSGGMVVGAMGSGGLRGVKTYTCIDLSEYVNEETKDDFKYLGGFQRSEYTRARQYGLEHLEAMVYCHMRNAGKI